jgi:hypothetical protein
MRNNSEVKGQLELPQYNRSKFVCVAEIAALNG